MNVDQKILLPLSTPLRKELARMIEFQLKWAQGGRVAWDSQETEEPQTEGN